MPRRRKKEKTFKWNTEYELPRCLPRSSMTAHPKDFPSLRRLAILDSLTSPEKLGRKVTNEDLQATMMQVLKTIENITLEIGGEVSRLCSLTGSLQRRLDLEYFTPNNGHFMEMVKEANPEREPVIPLFPLLEEKKDEGKNNEGFRVSELVVEEIL
ncbi:hypothetical protein ACFXTI_027983 [Malus domestica]